MQIQTCAVIFLNATAPNGVDTRQRFQRVLAKFCSKREHAKALQPRTLLCHRKRSCPGQAQHAKSKLSRTDIYTTKHKLPSRPNRTCVKCRNVFCATDIPPRGVKNSPTLRLCVPAIQNRCKRARDAAAYDFSALRKKLSSFAKISFQGIRSLFLRAKPRFCTEMSSNTSSSTASLSNQTSKG